MARYARNNRFTIYDAKEARGDFRINPANSDSQSEDGTPLYKGPVEYPKMLYHPQGQFRIVKEAEIVETAMGPKLVGEQRELVCKTVEDTEAEHLLLETGWHLTPREAVLAAIAAGAKLAVPPENPATQLQSKDREIEELKRQLAALQPPARVADLTEHIPAKSESLASRLG